MTETTIKISDIDCAACVARLDSALNSMPGISSASINYAAGNALISYDEAEVGLADIARRIRRAGYVVPVEEAELTCGGADDGTIAKARSALEAVYGVKETACAPGGKIIVSLWPVGTDSAALLRACRDAGVWAEAGELRGGDEDRENMVRLKLLRTLIVSTVLTMPLVWDLPPMIQLALATLVQFGPGMYFYRGAWRALRGGGLSMWGVIPGLRALSPRLPGACELPKNVRRRYIGKPLIIGLLTGIMPCGASYAMWVYSMGTGSAARGAVTMLVWSLGTVPLMLIFGSIGAFIPAKYSKWMIKISAVFVAALGLLMLTKGIKMA